MLPRIELQNGVLVQHKHVSIGDEAFNLSAREYAAAGHLGCVGHGKRMECAEGAVQCSNKEDGCRDDELRRTEVHSPGPLCAAYVLAN